MTKRLIALFICTVMLALTGCSTKNDTPATESTTTESTAENTTTENTTAESTDSAKEPDAEEADKDMMTILDLVRNISIKMILPEGNELNEEARDLIMDELKSKIFRIFDRDVTDLTVELKAEEIYTDGNITSIAFTGYGYVKNAAYPINMCLPINYDANTAYGLGLADIYHINDEFTRIVETYAINTFGEARSYYFERYYRENLEEKLNYADTHLSTIYSYYSKDYVTVVFEVSHVFGDHIDVKIPKSELESFLISDADTAAVLDTLRANAEGDNNAKWLSSFFSGDFNTCASMIDAEPSALAMLCTVKFGSIRMREMTTTDSYGYSHLKDEITFTVTESMFESLPVGKYTYRMIKAHDSLFNVGSWERLSEAVSVPEDAMELIRFMLPHTAPHNVDDYTLTDSEKASFEHGVSDLIFYLDSRLEGDGFMTTDEFSNAAKLLFGLDSLTPNEKYASETTYGLWQQIGHGGFSCRYEVTRVVDRDDKLEVYVQLFGDYMSLSRSHTAKFTLSKTDSVYGYCFDKIEYTDEGDCDPWGFMN